MECEPLLKLLDEYENDKSKNSSFPNPLPVHEELPPLADGSDKKVSYIIIRLK